MLEQQLIRTFRARIGWIVLTLLSVRGSLKCRTNFYIVKNIQLLVPKIRTLYSWNLIVLVFGWTLDLDFLRALLIESVLFDVEFEGAQAEMV